MEILTFILVIIALSLSFYNFNTLSGKIKKLSSKQYDLKYSLYNLRHKVTTNEDQCTLLDAKIVSLSMTKKKGRPRKKVTNGK